MSLDIDKRSALHAKCVVADGKAAFISSANFTEAALFRNIEAGVLLRNRRDARRTEGYFTELIEKGALLPMSPFGD